MGNMKLEFLNKFGVNVSVLGIRKYPVHWHDALEIVYVLKGSVTLRLGVVNHQLNEDDFAIINPGEVHEIYDDSLEKSQIMLIQIDANICNKCCDDIYKEWIYCFSPTNEKEFKDDLDQLRGFIAKIVWQIDNFNDEKVTDRNSVENLLAEMIQYMLENFAIANVMARSKLTIEDLKSSEQIIERYKRIFKTLCANYTDKISLSDIAEQENISLQYLSADIKEKLGFSFQEILNIYRVEKSEKLLLGSNMNILEISLECGFSDPKYLDKNFVKYYGSTPSEFRKKMKYEDSSISEDQVKTHSISNAYRMINEYLDDSVRDIVRSREILEVNPNATGNKFLHHWQTYINLGNYSSVLWQINQDDWIQMKDDLGYEYLRIQGQFIECSSEKQVQLYWRMLSNAVKQILKLGLKPMIVLEIEAKKHSCHLEKLADFIKDCENEYGSERLKTWFFEVKHEEGNDEFYQFLKESSLGLQVGGIKKSKCEENSLNDTIFMIPYVIQLALLGNQPIDFLQGMDNELSIKNDSDQAVFYGGNGLMTVNGLKKASYYALLFLAQLGNELIKQGNGYVVTRKDGDYQILLYNYDTKRMNYSDKGFLNALDEKEIMVSMKDLSHHYRISRYHLNCEHGSTYDRWVNMGEPGRLSRRETKLLDRFSVPEVHYEFVDSNSVDYEVKLKSYGAELIILEKVE